MFFFKPPKPPPTPHKEKKQQHQQQQQKDVQKHKIKNAYWPIASKMTTSTQFPTKDILTPHQYKMTLRAYLTSN